MDRQQIRLKRVRDLVAAEGGLARFAERLGMSNSQVSQFAGKNPSRNIGNSVAAKIETAYGKPAGWLDHVAPTDLEGDSDAVSTSPDGSLHAIQLREAAKILGLLDDANLSTALGFLQKLLKEQSSQSGTEQPPLAGAPQDAEVKFTVGRRSPGPRRHGTS